MEIKKKLNTDIKNLIIIIIIKGFAGEMGRK
jgi:hypothetical protein